MFDSSFIVDARLKAHFIGLSSNQVALRRLQAKLVKKAAKLRAKELKPKDGDNTDVKAELLSKSDYRLSMTNRMRHTVRCQARAVHLLRQFLKGKPYLSTENNIKKETLSAARVIADYLPKELMSTNYNFIEGIKSWSTK